MQYKGNVLSAPTHNVFASYYQNSLPAIQKKGTVCTIATSFCLPQTKPYKASILQRSSSHGVFIISAMFEGRQPMFPSIRWASTRELCKTARRKQSYTLDRCVLSHTEFRGKASLFPLKYLSNAHTALCWNCNRTNTNKHCYVKQRIRTFCLLVACCSLTYFLHLAPRLAGQQCFRPFLSTSHLGKNLAMHLRIPTARSSTLPAC